MGESLARDTAGDVEALQIDRWRAMTPVEKLALVSSLSNAVNELAKAGIKQRYPDASDRERFLRLALLRLGPDLARRAYPEIADLADSGQ